MKRTVRWFIFLALMAAQITLFRVPTYAQDCTSAVQAPGCTHGLPSAEYEALLGIMLANPAPPVQPIGVDPTEVRRWSFWQIDRKGVTYYDSPGGMPIETTDPGYSFVSPKNRVEGWAEVTPSKWVSESNLSGTRASGFTGVKLGALPFPMAWIVTSTRPSAAPGAKALKATPILPQYTRVNIFKTVQVGQWEWYLVGPGQWVEQRKVGRVMPIAPPGGIGGRWVAVDLYEQVLVAYEGSVPVFATLISSGLPKWPTEEGLFKVWAKLKTDGMTGSMGKPDYYNIPIVPYVMYFNGSMALHGAFWHNSFGHKHSHGCINMTVGDAHWLFEWATVDMPVYVFKSR